MATEAFFLGQATTSTFRAVLDLTQHLSKQQKIRSRFTPAGRLLLRVDDVALKEALSKRHVEEDTFTNVFNNELSSMLNAIVHGEEKNLVDQWCNPGWNTQLGNRSNEEIQEYRKILDQKVEWTKELITDELRAKYLIKKTSKHYKLRNYSWEVNQKLVDKDEARILEYPYVTLKFETIDVPSEMLRGPMSQVIRVMFPGFDEWAGRAQTITFDADYDELVELVDGLNSAKRVLGEKLGRKAK